MNFPMFVSKCFIIPVRSQVTPRAEVLSRNAFRRLMHSSASPWGGLRADVGTLLIVHFKVLVFPYPRGIFFLAKFPVFGEAKHPTGFEDALQNFSLVL